MADCPDVSALEAGASADLDAHLASCSSCRVVVELLAERRRGLNERDRRNECARFEMLLAARDEGTLAGVADSLLDLHLLECAECRAVAATASPNDTARSGPSLPAVSTANYALGREVARGGMGRILEARDTRIDRPVAIKELLGRAPSLAARFEREARVTARLQHPGIVPIYEIGTWPDGTPFYAMRMVEGRTLRETIRDKKTLNDRLALLPSMIAAAEAVAFAHGKRIIHRDLTPNNILVGAHGDTVVIDWGLAKDLGATDDEDLAAGPYRDEPAQGPNLTTVGAVIGTAAYMPPEQARGASVDERADVYALGAMLYHLLAGAPPYPTGSSDQILELVQAGPPAPIAETAPGAPRDLISIVDKAMAREPLDRYVTAAQLVDELRRFQTGRVVEAHDYSTRERLRRWVRAHRGAVIAAFTAMLALAVAGTIGFVGVVRERDRAEHERVNATMAKERAQQQNAALMAEQGRQEMLAGNTTRALAWFNEAYKAGDTTPELRFMLGTALQRIESVERSFHCDANSVAFSHDGQRAMASCAYGIGIMRTSDWTPIVEIDAQTDGGTWSHDAQRIATKKWGTLTVWNAATGAQIFERREHAAMIRMMAFTRDDRLIVTTGDDAKLRVWNAATGEVLRTIDAGSGSMNVVRGQLMPDGDSVLTYTADGLVQRWEIASGKRLLGFKLPVQFVVGDEGTALSADGSRLATCGVDGFVRISDTASGQLVSTISAHPHAAMDCRLSSDGRFLMTSGLDGTAKIWDFATQRIVSTLPHGSWFVKGAFSPDAERAATLAVDGTLKVWHTATGSLLASVDDPFGLSEHVVFSPDGHRLVTTREPSSIVVMRDIASEIQPLKLPAGSTALGASPDGRLLELARGDETLSLVSTATGASISHEVLRRPLAWSRDSARVAAIGDSGAVIVVDTATGKTLARADVGKVEMLALDEHGRRLLIAAGDAQVWDVDHQRRELVIGKHTDKDSLSRDGKLAVAWNDPRTVEIWNLEDRRVQARLRLERDTFGPVGFDATGDHVIIAERETARVITGAAPWIARLSFFDTKTGAKLRDFSPTVASSIDTSGRLIVVSGVDKRLHVFRTDGTPVSSIAPGAAFFMAGETLGGGALMAVADQNGVAIRSSTDGRLLASLKPTLRQPQIGQDSFHMNSHDMRITSEGRTILLLGPHPVVWRLPEERRSPVEVDRIVRKHVRWKVVDGHLLPVDAVLRGRVIRDGVPVAGATIAIDRQGAAAWLEVVTDARGEFEVRSARWGIQSVIALAPDKSAVGMRQITIDNEQVSAVIELDQEASISGMVVDEAGQPVAGARVAATRSEIHTISDANGAFTLGALHRGGYDVNVVVKHDGKPTGFEPASPPPHVSLSSNSDRATGVKIVVRRVP